MRCVIRWCACVSFDGGLYSVARVWCTLCVIFYFFSLVRAQSTCLSVTRSLHCERETQLRTVPMRLLLAYTLHDFLCFFLPSRFCMRWRVSYVFMTTTVSLSHQCVFSLSLSPSVCTCVCVRKRRIVLSHEKLYGNQWKSIFMASHGNFIRGEIPSATSAKPSSSIFFYDFFIFFFLSQSNSGQIIWPGAVFVIMQLQHFYIALIFASPGIQSPATIMNTEALTRKCVNSRVIQFAWRAIQFVNLQLKRARSRSIPLSLTLFV